jgi:hypothetical protein
VTLQVVDQARLPQAQHHHANWERGEREMPSSLLRILYETYHVDPVWILVGPGCLDVVHRNKRASLNHL